MRLGPVCSMQVRSCQSLFDPRLCLVAPRSNRHKSKKAAVVARPKKTETCLSPVGQRTRLRTPQKKRSGKGRLEDFWPLFNHHPLELAASENRRRHRILRLSLLPIQQAASARMVKHFPGKDKADERKGAQRLWAEASSAPRNRQAKAADVTAVEERSARNSSDQW